MTVRVVDLDKLKIPFAIDAAGRWIKAPDVDLAAPPIGPTCPGCGEPVTFRRGSAGRIPHFAHRANSACSNEGYEGLSHQKLKEATADLIDEFGAGALIHAAPAEAEHRQGAVIEEAYPGTAGLRSDVGVLLPNGKLLGFEIVVAHELSIRKVNAVTQAGHLICAMNGFGFTEHIKGQGGAADFDIDADARAFVLKWRFGMKRGTPVGTRTAAPAGVEFVGGSAVNCHAVGMPAAGAGGAGTALLSSGFTDWASVADDLEPPAGAKLDGIARQHALRKWHTRPDLYPDSFEAHVGRGDFDGEVVNNE